MAITSNVDLINSYDNNMPTVSTRALPDIAPHDDEHAAQCLAIEMLRGLTATGMSVAEYNGMSNEVWEAIKTAAYARSSMNINAPSYQLSVTDREQAANIGGNFFERGYVTVMAGISQSDKITFTRIGG